MNILVWPVEGLATEQYRRARTLYANLEAKVRELNAAIEDESDRLEQLNRLLKDLPLLFLDYRTCVRDLQAHRTAIAVNLQNYQTCLSHLFLEGDGIACKLGKSLVIARASASSIESTL